MARVFGSVSLLASIVLPHRLDAALTEILEEVSSGAGDTYWMMIHDQRFGDVSRDEVASELGGLEFPFRSDRNNEDGRRQERRFKGIMLSSRVYRSEDYIQDLKRISSEVTRAAKSGDPSGISLGLATELMLALLANDRGSARYLEEIALSYDASGFGGDPASFRAYIAQFPDGSRMDVVAASAIYALGYFESVDFLEDLKAKFPRWVTSGGGDYTGESFRFLYRDLGVTLVSRNDRAWERKFEEALSCVSRVRSDGRVTDNLDVPRGGYFEQSGEMRLCLEILQRYLEERPNDLVNYIQTRAKEKEEVLSVPLLYGMYLAGVALDEDLRSLILKHGGLEENELFEGKRMWPVVSLRAKPASSLRVKTSHF